MQLFFMSPKALLDINFEFRAGAFYDLYKFRKVLIFLIRQTRLHISDQLLANEFTYCTVFVILFFRKMQESLIRML